MIYTYYATARPATPGAIPEEGLEAIENFNTRRNVGHCMAWSRVTYNRPLSAQELARYEMSDNLPIYKSIDLPDLRDLSVACLQNPDDEKAEEAYMQAYGRQKAIYKRLFRDLESRKIDIFFYDIGTGNSYSRMIFTRSAKKPGTIQKTCIWMRNGEEIPLSDCCRATFEEHEKAESFSDGVTVYYGIA